MRTLVLSCLFCWVIATAQQPDKDQVSNMIGAGWYLHSFGMGFSAEYQKIKDEGRLAFQFSAGSLKDKHEEKVDSYTASQGGTRYIFDKKNYAYTVTLTAGYDKLLFSRGRHFKTEIHAGFMAGPSLVLSKPYYLQVLIPSSNPAFLDLIVEPYDENIHTYTDIYGAANFFEGGSSFGITPGGRVKGRITLDFSASRLFVRAVEAAVFADYYSKKIELMGKGEDHQLFIGGSIGFTVGNAW